MAVIYELRDGVALLTVDNPPVNGLDHDTRRRLTEAVEQACADEQVHAILITGAGRAFSGGADIREFGTPKAVQEPHLLTLIRTVEEAPKPVIAAIHSVCMGGGLELSLGCHYRVAARGAQLALPE